MDYLLDYAQQEGVQELVRRYLEHSDLVQGIAIDLDDDWLGAWLMYNALPRDEFKRWVDAFPPYYLRRDDRFPPNFSPREHSRFLFGLDIAWTPPHWDEFMEWRGLRPDPRLLIVVLRLDAGHPREQPLQYIETGGIQVRFEARPMARLLAKPTDNVRPLVGGLSVSSPSGLPGTLGGIVSDTHGTRYALTCSHVVASGDEAHQPSPTDNKKLAGRVGVCSDSTPLTSHTGQLDAYAAATNTIDAAVIELDSGVPADLDLLGVGALAGVASKSYAHPNSAIDVVGMASGHQSLYIGPANLVHEFDFDNTKYAFGGLFELRRSSRFYGVTGSFRPPVRGGDSGAWVLRAGASGPELLGVVLAGDGPCGYAMPADNVMEWIENQTQIGTVTVQ